MAEQLAGQAAVVQVNTQHAPGLAARFGVRGIPVTALLKDGRMVDQLPGAQTLKTMLTWFRQRIVG